MIEIPNNRDQYCAMLRSRELLSIPSSLKLISFLLIGMIGVESVCGKPGSSVVITLPLARGLSMGSNVIISCLPVRCEMQTRECNH